MALKIIMLGAPGAGKGTQAKRLALAYGLPHISTGDIFRAHLNRATHLGKQVQQYLEAGRLVPDDLTCEIVADRLKESDCANGFILDGFPRSTPQAEMLRNHLAGRGESVSAAINVEVPDSEIVERLTARRTCSLCGTIFNLKFDPPSGDATQCDRNGCGGRLIRRKDDEEVTIRERLRVYHETTEPVIGYYEKLGVLRTVSGAGATPEEIFAKIESMLGAPAKGPQP